MPAPVEVARWAIASLVMLTLVVSSIGDIRNRRIPNWTVVAIALLFLPWALIGIDVSVKSSLVAALTVLLASFVLYTLRVVGAGDSKLISVVALFIGLPRLPQFLVYVALAGGALAIMSLVTRPARALVMFQMRGKGDFGRGVPYGVAITVGAIIELSAILTHQSFF